MEKEFTIFTLAIKNLKRKPLRTGILIISLAITVSVLVFALSFARRLNSSIKITSERLGADIMIVPTGSRGAAENILLESSAKSFYMDKSIIDRVMAIKGIDKVTHQTYLVTMQGLCCDVPESVVVAFNQDTDFIIKPWLNKSIGRRLQPGEAIVGNESAFNIRVGLVDVDSAIFGNTFKMVGVLDKTGTGLDNALFIDEVNIDSIIKKGKTDIRPGQISIIFVKVKEGLDPYKVAGDIEDTIIEVDAVARKDIGKNLINTFRDINRVFIITVLIASLLSIFLTWSIFSAVVNERSREVGIMRAIGAKESHIAKILLTEVIVIGMVGSFLGLLCGTTLAIFMAKGFNIMKNIPNDLILFERIVISATGILSGVCICILGAIVPVQRIKRLEPLMIIRGE